MLFDRFHSDILRFLKIIVDEQKLRFDDDFFNYFFAINDIFNNLNYCIQLLIHYCFVSNLFFSNSNDICNIFFC